MIAPVMKVGSLRDCNITLHLNINSKREAVPDIPAIYVVEPTEENFQKIAEDAMSGIYDYFFVNFTRQVTREQLDSFAMEITKANAVHKICKVGYNHLNYHVVSQNLFEIPNGKNNFKHLYQGKESM